MKYPLKKDKVDLLSFYLIKTTSMKYWELTNEDHLHY